MAGMEREEGTRRKSERKKEKTGGGEVMVKTGEGERGGGANGTIDFHPSSCLSLVLGLTPPFRRTKDDTMRSLWYTRRERPCCTKDITMNKRKEGEWSGRIRSTENESGR
ncbi:hypothetical protein HZH66_002894 [Vespula vulgaris]|uniref:Uncharacterized protein n=1 Tax=Vespula vulgaris TaxID=7454 RepID=A0A834KM06_VESVU|nr:hypothetical protein HZH66_002894 [Vespula vulgaris]